MKPKTQHRRPVGLVITTLLAFCALTTTAAVSPRRHLTRPRPCVNGLCPQPMALIQNCEGARAYFADAYVEELLRAWAGYGWYRGGPSGGGEDGKGGNEPGDFSTTNNQEADVDEPDIVKTDGTHIFTVLDKSLFVLKSWPAEQTKLIASLSFSSTPESIFLRDFVVAVIGNGESYRGGIFREYNPMTTVSIVDVSNPGRPLLRRTIEIDGAYLGARMIGGHVYLLAQQWLWLPSEAWDLIGVRAVEIGLPMYDYGASPQEKEAAKTKARNILFHYVQEIVAKTDLATILPSLSYVDPSSGTKLTRPLISCSELYRPTDSASLGLLTLVHFDLQDLVVGGGDIKGVGLLANGWTIYASARNLYVANSLPWWWWFGEVSQKTIIHKFQLDGQSNTPVRYAATGVVPGYLLNQFSMGEYKGDLRVASTEFGWWRAPEDTKREGSTVSVLRDDGLGVLSNVGQVTDIAPGERIYSSRFMGDRGFLVTFEQVDPLFTLDLSEPSAPKVVGELEVPGFSNYLHLVGDNHLLAVGRMPDQAGRFSQVAASLFDVRDLAKPSLAASHTIKNPDGGWAWSEAQWDHHAFTFHRNVLSVPVTWYGANAGFSGLVELSVDLDKGFQEIGRVDHHEFQEGGYMPWIRRSVYIEDNLFSLSTAGVKVTKLFDPKTVLVSIKLAP